MLFNIQNESNVIINDNDIPFMNQNFLITPFASSVPFTQRFVRITYTCCVGLNLSSQYQLIIQGNERKPTKADNIKRIKKKSKY